MQNQVVINIKPSHRIVAKFKTEFPKASFYGRATLGGKAGSYLIDQDEYEAKKDLIKKFGTKAKHQPFLTSKI